MSFRLSTWVGSVIISALGALHALIKIINNMTHKNCFVILIISTHRHKHLFK